MSKKLPTIKEIKDKTDIVEAIGRYLNLKKDGIHFVAHCPFHKGDNGASLKVTPSKNMFKCFGCGISGDVFDFLIKGMGKTYKEALQELSDPKNIAAKPLNAQLDPSKKVITWTPLLPLNNEVPDMTHYTHGKPTAYWTYKNTGGNVIGYVCRFIINGEKTSRPFCFATDGKRQEWRWMKFGQTNPLYNLDGLAANPEKTVILGEGEKTADAISRLVPTAIATTFMFGAKSVKYTDFSPLYGRKVILWPDNDIPGFEAMQAIAAILKPHCKTIRWVKNPENVPLHWDVADATDWTVEFTREFILNNNVPVPEINEDQQNEIPDEEPPPALPVIKPFIPIQKPIEKNEDNADNPFRILGYQKENKTNVYHFYSYASRSVITLSPSSMSKANLLQLAPLDYWENKYPARHSFDVEAAQNALIGTANHLRVFSDKWIRGRGAWVDNKNVIIHTGDNLIVNGVKMGLGELKSNYVYEIGETMGLDIKNPLTNKEAVSLLNVLKLLNWSRGELDAYLLAGWCVIAPMCGALSWRPHAWVTGSAGSGKSWLSEKIVRGMLGDSSLAVQGSTTEAGLRQTLKHDAKPVVFDEAEGNDKKEQENMQQVLALVRAASTSDGGEQIKGSAGGTAQSFRIRSCFYFSSINVQATSQADITRVTVMSLKVESDKVKAEKNWKRLQNYYYEHITEDFGERLRSRTINLLPVILKNIRTFSAVAATELGRQRTGDQIGALLAGAYSLVSPNEIDNAGALKFIKRMNWDEEKGYDKTKDEVALISYIMGHSVVVDTPVGKVTRLVGELVNIVPMNKIETYITIEIATEALNRLGIRVDEDGKYIVISNSEPSMKRLLFGTPWGKNHNKILARINGAEPVDSIRFASGVGTRAIMIPFLEAFRGQ